MDATASVALVLMVFACTCGQRLELPAYEYIRRFHSPLILGQCPDRFVTYPAGSTLERCTYPNRHGETQYRRKNVDTTLNIVLRNAAQLFQLVGLCDGASADYFGILNTGDCVATEIASKLSFKNRNSARMYLEHYRPQLKILRPSVDLNIPEAYSQYLNNSFYTDNIGIGTEEMIIIDMQFAQAGQAYKASKYRMGSKLPSHNLDVISKHIAVPKKIKVIRMSTAEKSLQTRVFKGPTGLEEAKLWVESCERRIKRIRHELRNGQRTSHLKYGFKAYEIGPIALPLSSVSDTDVRQSWENVTLLQVDANRVYVTYKRYRKYCREPASRRTEHCVIMKFHLKDLKRVITGIHTHRRNWSRYPYEHQQLFITRGRQRIKGVQLRMKMAAKAIKRMRKTKSKG